MRCQFCQQEIKAGSVVCDWCGRRQDRPPPRRPLPKDKFPPVRPRPPAGEEPLSPPGAQPRASFPRGFFRWSLVREFLRADPLLATLFIIVGLNALFSVGQLVFSPNAFLPAIFMVLACFGLISFREWAWWVILAIYGLNTMFLFLAVWLIAEGRFAGVPLLLIEAAVSIFVVWVLFKRRSYFD